MYVVENRIELLTKLGDLKITEKSELASLAESLTVAAKYLESDISNCLAHFLALGTKASIWCGKHLKMTLMSTEESQEEEHANLFFELNLIKDSMSEIKVALEVIDAVIRLCGAYARAVNWESWDEKLAGDKTGMGVKLLKTAADVFTELLEKASLDLLISLLNSSQMKQEFKGEILDSLFSKGSYRDTVSEDLSKFNKISSLDEIFSLCGEAFPGEKALLLGRVSLFLGFLKFSVDLEEDVKLGITRKLFVASAESVLVPGSALRKLARSISMLLTFGAQATVDQVYMSIVSDDGAQLSSVMRLALFMEGFPLNLLSEKMKSIATHRIITDYYVFVENFDDKSMRSFHSGTFGVPVFALSASLQSLPISISDIDVKTLKFLVAIIHNYRVSSDKLMKEHYSKLLSETLGSSQK
ncbi:hypothetical protein Prudu_000438 [Prunus dulcis]|uniref:Uncharacterized protein n=1 Tax=Prunus dulcis TaxID=3755 RepID=A0A4Y1QLD3_PRUDU|nr:hypothetical protein Prudu_000438 [Prunus dulcis]